jgi:hypothetical protein
MPRTGYCGVTLGLLSLLAQPWLGTEVSSAQRSLPEDHGALGLSIADYQGPLGTDTTGRRNLCNEMKKLFPGPSGTSQSSLVPAGTREHMDLDCEDDFERTIVLTATNWSSDFPTIRSEQPLEGIISRPYRVVVDRLDGLVLRHGDKKPAANREIKAKLDGMKAVTIADLFFACGFDRVIVRDRTTGVDYWKRTLRGIGYGPLRK